MEAQVPYSQLDDAGRRAYHTVKNRKWQEKHRDANIDYQRRYNEAHAEQKRERMRQLYLNKKQRMAAFSMQDSC
jgi:hypothetical protein